jgi:hypothetical protein
LAEVIVGNVAADKKEVKRRPVLLSGRNARMRARLALGRTGSLRSLAVRRASPEPII